MHNGATYIARCDCVTQGGDTTQTKWQFTYRECHQVEWSEMVEYLREKETPEPWVRRQSEPKVKHVCKWER
jgi:hypothetical protein